MNHFLLFLSVIVGGGLALAQETPEPADFPGDARLLLPPVIHALNGLEASVYFDNAFLLLNPANVAVDVTCAKGSQQNERWTWTPKPEETGDFPITLDLRDGTNTIVARASSVVKVHPRAYTGPAKTPLSLLIIGDSLTAASIYPGRILELAKEDQLPLHLVGTRGPGVEEGKAPGEVRHEGYGGWTAERFATHFTGKARGGPYKECGSPFLYRADPAKTDEMPKLDFARYLSDVGETKNPDFVTILLGCNDTFGASDERLEKQIDTFTQHAKTLLAMIRSASPESRIGLILPMPPAGNQDAFGANYGSGQTRWQYRRNRHRLVERITATFSGREKDHIHLVAAHLNLDPVNGFPSATVPAHARTEVTTIRQINGVHPSAEGYRQIGDAVYAWMRSFDQPKRTQ
jgi:lysophospholipase L1-like esterase